MLAAAGSTLAQIGVGYRLLGSDYLRLVTDYSRVAAPPLERHKHLSLRLDELGGLAQAFREDPANARYTDRLKRAAALERYMLTGNASEFWKAVLT